MRKLIVQYPNKILRTETVNLDLYSTPISVHKRNFNQLLYASRIANGIGVAAPQIGICQSFFLFGKKIAVNPKITWRSEDTEEMLEGCLSLATNHFVERNKEIEVEYLNKDLVQIVERLSGLEARIFQHEYDHLMGKLILDYDK